MAAVKFWRKVVLHMIIVAVFLWVLTKTWTKDVKKELIWKDSAKILKLDKLYFTLAR